MCSSDSVFPCLCCVFDTEPIFSSSTGIQISVPLVDVLEDGHWEMKIMEQKDKRVRLAVNTLPTASIGRYKVTVESFSPKGKLLFPCTPNDIYMLFNPWCEGTESVQDNHTHFSLICINEVALHSSVFPQMIPCIWITKQKGKSISWIAWAEFTTEPRSKLEPEHGILPRCGNSDC